MATLLPPRATIAVDAQQPLAPGDLVGLDQHGRAVRVATGVSAVGVVIAPGVGSAIVRIDGAVEAPPDPLPRPPCNLRRLRVQGGLLLALCACGGGATEWIGTGSHAVTRLEYLYGRHYCRSCGGRFEVDAAWWARVIVVFQLGGTEALAAALAADDAIIPTP